MGVRSVASDEPAGSCRWLAGGDSLTDPIRCDSPPVEDSFRLLFVGTTNLGRSAMAERILREAIDHRWHWSASGRWIVESAGTRAVADQPLHPLVRQALRTVR